MQQSCTQGEVWVPIPADQKQNFASWYSCYRTRNYAARAGSSLVFKYLPENVRVGWGKINAVVRDINPVPKNLDNPDTTTKK
ncbi:MAG: hypothetical protein LBU11_04980 [Zoogloeaceae bacterium]|jgi:type IV pilus assembly protein PilY1|nr:hypothetical protein [Zoogloeaceae bacterium]